MRKPTWIVFEGIDGSGKTTQAKRLNEYLTAHGYRSLYKHVFDSEAGSLLRTLFIDNSFSNKVEILVLSAARQALLDELSEQVGDYDVLVVDRFFLSILAMQGRSEDDRRLISYLRRTICGPQDAHYILHLHTPPEDCRKRLVRRTAQDRIEAKGVEFHREVFDRYRMLLADEERVFDIDGRGDVEDVHRSVVRTTMSLLGAAPTQQV
ncbi:dTMP kinase [Streptomyces sp. NPDC021020]|uniref:dTMP kinase n=1 Tax=Streptomyces sp. NPDC021020 TaxID=3365109 RepID=UPI003791B786